MDERDQRIQTSRERERDKVGERVCVREREMGERVCVREGEGGEIVVDIEEGEREG